MPPHYLTAHSPHALGTSTPLWVIPVPRVPFPIFLIIPISSHLHSKHQSVSCSVHDLPSEPNHYTGKDMRTVHQHMPITVEHFERVWWHMEVSFRKHGAGEEVVK